MKSSHGWKLLKQHSPEMKLERTVNNFLRLLTTTIYTTTPCSKQASYLTFKWQQRASNWIFHTEIRTWQLYIYIYVLLCCEYLSVRCICHIRVSEWNLHSKWLRVLIPLLSLKLQIWHLLRARSSLTFKQTIECRFTEKLVRDIIITNS